MAFRRVFEVWNFPPKHHSPPIPCTIKSSNLIGVPEKGLPKTEGRPDGGSSFSSKLIIQSAGSDLPFNQALPSILHPPALRARNCNRSIVHSPDFHSNGMLAFAC